MSDTHTAILMGLRAAILKQRPHLKIQLGAVTDGSDRVELRIIHPRYSADFFMWIAGENLVVGRCGGSFTLNLGNPGLIDDIDKVFRQIM